MRVSSCFGRKEMFNVLRLSSRLSMDYGVEEAKKKSPPDRAFWKR